uniref:ATPase AAA-type core domain-containing protein n=1 Tax=Quercus lobata TaxID=97700 RepID=A0A7N2LTJ8_QUELO
MPTHKSFPQTAPIVRTRFVTNLNSVGFAREKAQTMSFVERGFERLGLDRQAVGFLWCSYKVKFSFTLGVFLLEVGWEALVRQELISVSIPSTVPSNFLLVAWIEVYTIQTSFLINQFWVLAGTGKTSCARVIANQAGVPLLYVPLESVITTWIGESERNLGRVFSHANMLPNGAIIFLDEIDSFATARNNLRLSETRRGLLSVLLRQIDGYEQDKKIDCSWCNK